MNDKQPLIWQRGITLIELVIVMVILGAVSIGIANFIRSSVQNVVGINDREQLLSGARFPVERIKRELEGAIPNSIRVNKQVGEHCIQFVPFSWSTVYLDLPLANTSDTQVEMPIVAPVDINGDIFTITPGSDSAIVYPLRADDIYNASNINTELRKIRDIDACVGGSCTAFTDNALALTLSNGFTDGSPAERVYIAGDAVSFCVVNNTLVRFTSVITATQPETGSAGGTIVANNINNTLIAGSADVFSEDDPFQHFASSRLRNAVVQIRLRFLLNGEFITFQQEVHIPNAP